MLVAQPLRRRLAPLLVGVALGSAGCGSLLVWDIEGHPCNADQECSSGYSCRYGTCVSESTVALGEPCTDDVQCADEALCATPLDAVCRTSCAPNFFTTTGCASGEWCKPASYFGEACDDVSDCAEDQSCRNDADGVSRCHYFVGLCVDGDGCDEDPSELFPGCPTAGDVCVPLTDTLNVCLPGCAIDWDSGAYEDNCNSRSGAETYCTAVGLPNLQRLVCLPTDGDGQVGDDCLALFPNPCAPGLACATGQCKRHCDLDGDGATYCSVDYVSEGFPNCVPPQPMASDEIKYGVCGN